jgi:predicted metal-binding protein
MPIPRITSDRNQEKLPQDLEKYREYALKLGATEAQVVNTSKTPVEEAVAFKCRVPQCFGYNTCAQCPPHAPKPAEIRQLLKGYGHGLLFVRKVNSELLKRNRDDKERKAAFMSILDIVRKLGVRGLLRWTLLGRGFQCRQLLFVSLRPQPGLPSAEGRKMPFPSQSSTIHGGGGHGCVQIDRLFRLGYLSLRQ